MTTIGITGAEGLVGTILRKYFIDKSEYTVKNFTLLPQKDFQSVPMDLSLSDKIIGHFEGIDIIIHLAADHRAEGPWNSILPNNILATYNVFREAVRAGVKKVIFASSNHTMNGRSIGKLIGNHWEAICDEYLNKGETKNQMKVWDPPAPDSDYAVSKLFGENLAKLLVLESHSKTKFINLRIGWIVHNDDISFAIGNNVEDYLAGMFCSSRDFIHAIECAFVCTQDYIVAHIASNNSRCVFDLEESYQLLGYKPKDSWEEYLSKLPPKAK